MFEGQQFSTINDEKKFKTGCQHREKIYATDLRAALSKM